MSSGPTDLTVDYYRATPANDQDAAAEHAERSLERAALPFLKWTGGKQWMAALAREWMPSDDSVRYYEPFLGGGATFFALGPERAFLSDVCAELITTFCAVRDDVESVIQTLEKYPNTADFFSALRARTPRLPHTIAARMIYLNKTAFNGIYRVNRQGRFNVPFGGYTNPAICNAPRLRQAAAALKGTTLRAVDFEEAVSRATIGDYVYFDPPYITGHQNNGFLKYNAPLFSWDDQLRLARLARRLRQRGVNVLVSNSDHVDVVSLYGGFHHYRTARRTSIGGRGSRRGVISEAVLSSAPLLGQRTVIVNDG